VRFHLAVSNVVLGLHDLLDEYGVFVRLLCKSNLKLRHACGQFLAQRRNSAHDDEGV